MNENQKQTLSLLNIESENILKNASENVSSRALNAIINEIKNKYGEAQVILGTAFSRYLKNATRRYNQIRTLATGTTPRTITGPHNVYVNVGVLYGKKKINTDTVDPLLQISNNILISGTGGIGKSMLMRHLFLNTANREEYIPVLLELRKISNQPSGHISFLDLIYTCMNDFDVQLPREQFEYSLRLGKYLFLLDGFDEVKEDHAKEVAEVIQAFCSKYPDNPCIITSRPRRDTSPFETFTTVESLPLSKEQAVLLASKIWEEDDKTKEFCRQLDDYLYEKHRDFAENPLLLSMMFLTFMRNNSVPNHLAEFYSKAYDALYSAHDSTNKGYYRREFQCNLDENEFRLLLSHFCFQTYFKEIYEFTKKSLLLHLNKSIQKLGFTKIKASNFLNDLCNVVCLLVEDGEIYRFSHRSFQTYFAACYTANILTDEQQEKLFVSILSEEIFWMKEDYFELLSQIEPQRFAANALEKELRSIQEDVANQPSPNIYFFKLQYRALMINENSKKREGISNIVGTKENVKYHYNVLGLFKRYVLKMNYNQDDDANWKYIRSLLNKIRNGSKTNRSDFPLEMIDSTKQLSNDERQSLYASIIQVNKVVELRTEIDLWLSKINTMRKKLRTDNFIDTL